MSELNEVAVNKNLLVGAKEALVSKQERFANINKAVENLKKQLMKNVDCGEWDQAQSTLEQVRKLAIDAIAAGGDVTAAQGRVDSLDMAIKRAEEAERVAASKRDQYAPSTKPNSAPEPKPEAAPVENAEAKPEASGPEKA